MESLTAHISFYFRSDRLPNLHRVVECIAGYDDFSRADVWVHTDRWFEGLPENARVVVHDLSGLHRKQLTWLHRPLLASQVDAYDVYMYLEDDILVPPEAIAYWREHEPVLTPLEIDLGFLRVETDDRGGEWVVDFHAGERCSEFETISGAPYVHLRHNYRGFWIYTREQLHAFAARPGFCDVPKSLRHIRERAARGVQTADTHTVIPLVEGRLLDPRCRVHHLTNDYWGDPQTLHAKVRYEDLLVLDESREWRCTLFDDVTASVSDASPYVDRRGSPAEGTLAPKVVSAFDHALAELEGGDPPYLVLDGMSGRRYRRFVNTLVGSLEDARYLEVGVWAGSTLCSALASNEVVAVGIDNWSQYGGPREQALDAVSAFTGMGAQATVLDADFRTVDFSTLGTFNVYLYDGPHGEEDQFAGLALALPALDDEFVFVVDDWNWLQVREGTRRAIETLGLDEVYAIELRTTRDDNHPPHSGYDAAYTDWHNGYYMAVLRRTH